MIGSIRLDDTTTCMTIAGATDTDVFRAYVGEVLYPVLHKGDIAVVDNLGAHKSAATLVLTSQLQERRCCSCPPIHPKCQSDREDAEQGEGDLALLGGSDAGRT